MPRYRVRLVSPDLIQDNGEPHFRVAYINADSAEQAGEKVLAQDQRMVADPDHPQRVPYELVYAVPRGEVPEVTR